jgi:hypothetical protein
MKAKTCENCNNRMCKDIIYVDLAKEYVRRCLDHNRSYFIPKKEEKTNERENEK